MHLGGQRVQCVIGRSLLDRDCAADICAAVCLPGLSHTWGCYVAVNFSEIESKAEANDLAVRVDRVCFKQEPRCIRGYEGIQVRHDSLSPQEGTAEIILSIAGLPYDRQWFLNSQQTGD
jgi:hypothetical protein